MLHCLGLYRLLYFTWSRYRVMPRNNSDSGLVRQEQDLTHQIRWSKKGQRMFMLGQGLRWTKMVFTSYLHFQHCHSRSPYLKYAEAGRGLPGGSDGNISENYSYLIQHISVEIFEIEISFNIPGPGCCHSPCSSDLLLS